MSYSDLLKDPRWQRKRLEIMQRAGFACESCGDTTTTLNVHHIEYVHGRKPWEYADDELQCVCENCHGPGEGRREPLPPKPDPARAVFEYASTAERELIRVLLHRPEYLERVVERIGNDDFRDAELSRIFASIVWVGADAKLELLIGFLRDFSAEDGGAGGNAEGKVRELLTQTSGLERAEEIVAGSLAAMYERELTERMAEIGRAYPAASESEKDDLTREKMGISDELRRLGGRWWKKFK